MRIKLFISAGVVTAAGIIAGSVTPVLAGPAQGAIYPYATSENYCPAGLQPITISGVICCGKPTTTTTYQQMMRHVSSRPRVRAASTRRTVCPVGQKGCVTR